MIAKLDPVKSANRVAGMVTAGYVTEEHAVAYLAENAHLAVNPPPRRPPLTTT